MGKKQEKITWGIANFPRTLKNKFVGLVKSQGENIGDVVEYLIARYIREQRGKDT